MRGAYSMKRLRADGFAVAESNSGFVIKFRRSKVCHSPHIPIDGSKIRHDFFDAHGNAFACGGARKEPSSCLCVLFLLRWYCSRLAAAPEARPTRRRRGERGPWPDNRASRCMFARRSRRAEHVRAASIRRTPTASLAARSETRRGGSPGTRGWKHVESRLR